MSVVDMPADEAAVLEVRDLCVSYGRGRHQRDVVSGVSFSVSHGETVAVVGESGAGKSTTGRAILGLVPASAGSIIFKGHDITHASHRLRRSLSGQLQAVFQDPYSSLNPTRTIGDTLIESVLSTGLRPAQRTARAREVLGKVGLPADVLSRYPGAFSGGQRQRIAIARALMSSPDLIVVDEALSSLDLSFQAQIINLLRDLQEESGVAMVFISHDLAVVRHLAHVILVLYGGKVVELAPAKKLCSAPHAEYTKKLLAAAPVPDPEVQSLRLRAHQAQGHPAAAAGSGEAPPPAKVAANRPAAEAGKTE